MEKITTLYVDNMEKWMHQNGAEYTGQAGTASSSSVEQHRSFSLVGTHTLTKQQPHNVGNSP